MSLFRKRPEPVDFVVGLQFTAQTADFVTNWTGGLLVKTDDPRDTRLNVHIENGLAGAAKHGDWILKNGNVFEVLTCAQLYARYEMVDRPGFS